MSIVVCVLVPRFGLRTAVGEREELLRRALALAPEPDREQVVGEVSGAAEAHGVRPGMRLGEALARCPDLRLVSPDPERADARWQSLVAALEGIGAAVEPPAAGEAYFDAAGLRRLHGGNLEGVIAAARRALATPVRIGAAPSRFCAFAAAKRARPGRAARVVPAGAERVFLAPLPVSLLRARLPARGARDDVPAVLERLGVRTLGELAALATSDVADRFGRGGLVAHRLAHGVDEPLAPRAPNETLVERIDLPDAVSGIQLERMLALLVDRLLARPERRARTFRRLRIGARFVERGTWRREVTLREATAQPERLRLALAPKLGELPAPIERLSLAVAVFGPPDGGQLSLARPDGGERRKRLLEALRQARAAAGGEALLRVLEVDPESRVPERRAFLTPFPE